MVLPAAEYRPSKTEIGHRAPLIAPSSPSQGHRKAVASLPIPALLPRRWARLLALVLISLLAASSLDAAHPASPGTDHPLSEPRFTSVGVGIIPRYVVPTIAQDRAGILWMATGAGLVRFDGYRFRPQERDTPDPTTRNLGWIRALLAGRDGRLWIGTESDGLAVYDPASESVASCGQHTDRIGGVMPTIRALAEDTAGGIWVGTQQGDLAIIDPATSQGLLLDEAPDSVGPGGVSSLVEAPGGLMWAGRSSGIEIHDLRDGRLLQRLQHDPRRPSSLAGNDVAVLMRDHAGLTWVGGYGRGLQRHDPNNRGIWLRGADTLSAGPFSEADVRSLLHLRNGEIWAATRKGGVAVMDSQLRVTGAVWPQSPRPVRAAAQAAGDAVLKQMSDRLGTVFRETDYLVR